MQKIKNAGGSNGTNGSLLKAVATEDMLTWVSPAENEVFKLTQDAALPAVVFEFSSRVAGDCTWSWVIEWEAKASGLRERARKGNALQVFRESGSFVSASKTWTANLSGQVLGGTLTVSVAVNKKTLTRSVFIKGQNPGAENVATYIATFDDMPGFEMLLEQETRSKHFIDFDSEPIVAFDKGYGMTQVTTPAPTYEQVWNWKANILAGSSIYKDKVRAAKKYLAQAGRVYTDEQLRHETFSRWNGGSYHEWDASANAWVRKNNTLCDSNTGNIGWSMSNEKNKDQAEVELRKRDKDTYKEGAKGQSDKNPWTYTGVCYADHVLSK